MEKRLFGFSTSSKWDYENGFFLTSHVSRIAKKLALFELYKTIVELPGHIIECGVFKGISLISFATFREILESPFSRKIIGFDAFGKFPRQNNHDELEFISKFETDAGDGISVEELKQVFAHKSFDNYELIQGDILETVPKYVCEHPELKISLLHVDVDVYEPSLAILNQMYNKVVKGGLIVFDDFGTVSGETRAIDTFLADKKDKHIYRQLRLL
ncbi:dTDP-6-deoxy-L-hexose 3-O-methyltransferase [Candidatus Magnetoovum chiemensis]|nr:dTDP-6-deoxy-L-hexose 3-O-methyltransferase [Candidatus Magnetoovum chiemensis]